VFLVVDDFILVSVVLYRSGTWTNLSTQPVSLMPTLYDMLGMGSCPALCSGRPELGSRLRSQPR
jgi:hypothetical protein